MLSGSALYAVEAVGVKPEPEIVMEVAHPAVHSNRRTTQGKNSMSQ